METFKYELDCAHLVEMTRKLSTEYINWVRCPFCRENPDIGSWVMVMNNGLYVMRDVSERASKFVHWYEVIGFLPDDPTGKGYKYLRPVKSKVTWS